MLALLLPYGPSRRERRVGFRPVCAGLAPLVLLAVAACGNQVVITPSQGGCTDYNFDDPAASAIEWEAAKDGTARAWRSNALLEKTGLIFDPLITVEGNVVEVFEAWAGGETDDAFCYEPSVGFEGLGGELEVRWYLAEGESVPYDTVDIEVP